MHVYDYRSGRRNGIGHCLVLLQAPHIVHDNAEIDWAIAYRFTVLRNPPADNQLKPRSKEPAIDRPLRAGPVGGR